MNIRVNVESFVMPRRVASNLIDLISGMMLSTYMYLRIYFLESKIQGEQSPLRSTVLASCRLKISFTPVALVYSARYR